MMKEAREELGLTLADLCRETGVPRMTLHYMETDGRIPKREYLLRVTSRLGLNAKELLWELYRLRS